jgi:hypothetical protein
MAREKQPKAVHQMTAAQFDTLFKTEDDCKAYLVARRWPQGVRCPRCGNEAVYDLPSNEWHWQGFVTLPCGESRRFAPQGIIRLMRPPSAMCP